MFDIIQSVGAEAAIKIRKNAVPENIRGSKRRRKEARVYKRLRYRKWAMEKNTVSRSKEGLIAEGYQRFYAYNAIKCYAESKGGVI